MFNRTICPKKVRFNILKDVIIKMCEFPRSDIIDVEYCRTIRYNFIVEELRRLDELYMILSYLRNKILKDSK